MRVGGAVGDGQVLECVVGRLRHLGQPILAPEHRSEPRAESRCLPIGAAAEAFRVLGARHGQAFVIVTLFRVRVLQLRIPRWTAALSLGLCVFLGIRQRVRSFLTGAQAFAVHRPGHCGVRRHRVGRGRVWSWVGVGSGRLQGGWGCRCLLWGWGWRLRGCSGGRLASARPWGANVWQAIAILVVRIKHGQLCPGSDDGRSQ
mmetsp:Transcript_59565/g.106231  ORF Transcript_59565/g.106231 Transcript_59565/m.106231 type:complete len:202 (+) Transcript_59565:356-961(+)